MTEAQFLATWLKALDRFELQLRGQIGKQINHTLATVAAGYARGLGTIPTFLYAEHERRVAATLTTHYERVIPFFGRWATDQMRRRKMEEKALNDMFLSLMSEWISRNALAKAKMIAGTTLEDIRVAIDGGIDEGLGVPEIARNIRRVSQLTKKRAATIARTETHQAATFGSVESIRQAEQELGVVMLKKWLPTQDARTREDHAAMVNHPAIPLDEKFKVGSVMMDRPGDTSAPAEQTINCRCTLIYSEAG